jgi:hypothetical protein
VTARLALKSAAFRVRDMRPWLPFRYGVVIPTHFAHLLAMEIVP